MCKKIEIHSTRGGKSSFLHITVTREALGVTKIMEVAEEWPFCAVHKFEHLMPLSVLVIVWVFWYMYTRTCIYCVLYCLYYVFCIFMHIYSYLFCLC